MKKIILFTLFLVSTFSFSQEYNLEDAQKTRKEFLQVLKILDSPERKELLTDLVFPSSNVYPMVSSSNLLSEQVFDTDIDEVKGYKALLEIQSVNKPDPLQYILISYLDKKENKWKVFNFRKNIDTEEEVQSSKSSLTDENDPRKMQLRLRNLAYWQIMNGELLGAMNNYSKAYEEATADKDVEFEIPTYLVLDAIIDIRTLKKRE